MATKHILGRLVVHHRTYTDIRICPQNQTETVTIATMGIWTDSHRAELLAYADLFATAPETKLQRDELLESLTALGVMPDGYCFCHQNRDPLKTDNEHTGECRDARAAIAKAELS